MHFLSRHRLLILALICFGAMYAMLHTEKNAKIVEPERLEFINSLHSKELLAERLADSLMEAANRNQIPQFANSDNPRPDNLYNRHGIILYLYEGKNLTYWTNSNIAIPEGEWYKTPFVHSGNAYIIPKIKTSDTRTAVAAIVVKEEYSYENAFLKNHIHPSFDIDSELEISMDDRESENAVYSNDGNYLFTFSLKESDVTADKRKAAYPLLLLSLLLLLLYAQQGIKKNRLSNRKFFTIALIAIGVRIALQVFIPRDFYNQMPVFQPQHFASSVVFPSLGDMLVTVVLVAYLIFVYFYKVHLQRLDKYSVVKRTAVLVTWIAVLGGYFFGMQYLMLTLIRDSSFQIEVCEFTNMNLYGAASYSILLMLFVGFLFLLSKASIQILKTYSFVHAMAIIVPTLLAASLLWLHYYDTPTNRITCAALISLTVIWFHLRLRQQVNYVSIAMFIGLFAIYVTAFLRIEEQRRQDEECEVMAIGLAQVQDPVAEMVLNDVINDMKTDSELTEILQSDEFDYDYLCRYVQNRYFTGYMNRYNFTLSICDSHNNLTAGAAVDQQNCYTYYNRYLRQYGTRTQVRGLFNIKDPRAETAYLFRVIVPVRHGSYVTMYFELSLKMNYESLGYPELLLEKPLSTEKYKQHISYAKYQSGRLVLHSGQFPYAFDRQVYGQHDRETEHFQYDKFDHVIYNKDADNCIIVSTPSIHMFNLLISFTFSFSFFILMITLLALLANSYTKLFDIRFTIKNKILSSIMVILFISSAAIVAGVVYYTINHYQQSQNDIMTSKIQSILMEMEQRYSRMSDIRRIPTDDLNNTLTSSANIFLTDINLYDRGGNLVATSRREIYSRKLTSNKMNATAYRELEINKKSRFIHKENIGQLEYYSAYVPFINAQNRLLGYINLPYFIKQADLREELTNVSVTVINIFVVIIIISIVIAFFLSKRITKPIIDVQERIRSIDIGKSNQRVEYEGDDEIAELVNEYNLMLDELSISAARLAKSEREIAWREMARQVAHEIKNPLTPMKLSVQLLERSLHNGDPDFKERFENTSRTMIEQIDSLSSIASEFSQFARMPEGHTEIVNLNERINQSVELFRDTTNTQINFTEPAGRIVKIMADNDRMLQVFNNLIKNAIQAIPQKRKGRINISLRCFKGRAVVEVQDNGTGISPETEPKLFQPNFTTKTSGTGLGLAIVKNIVEEAGGAIWFRSKPGRGTSFFVSFPLAAE